MVNDSSKCITFSLTYRTSSILFDFLTYTNVLFSKSFTLSWILLSLSTSLILSLGVLNMKVFYKLLSEISQSFSSWVKIKWRIIFDVFGFVWSSIILINIKND